VDYEKLYSLIDVELSKQEAKLGTKEVQKTDGQPIDTVKYTGWRTGK